VHKQERKIALLYVIPILIAFLFELVFKEFEFVRVLNLVENVLFALLIYTLGFIIVNKNFQKVYFILSFLFLSICILFEILYYYVFTTNFSSSSIFIALDTNSSETKEFIDFYADTTILVFTFVFVAISFYCIFLMKPIARSLKKISKYKFKIFWIIIGALIFLKISKLIVYNLPYLIVKSSIEYSVESKKLGDYKNNKKGNFSKVSRHENEDDELYVIIIGESTSRAHFGLYNYYRQTTPNLNKIKEDLLVYNDVISPHVFSIGALTKILTLANYENPDITSQGSIIQLINSAGFNTYWLSNQRPIGPYESLITKISLSSIKHKFITTTIAGNSKVFDGNLIREFDKAIKEPVNKKVIFLHFLGTHHHYKNRYPNKFNKFKDIPKTEFKSNENFEIINHYDNAILYNDYLINEIIKKVDSVNAKSFVLYFSDHGEEVFDNLNVSGHNEDNSSKNMFDIPFVLWQSNKFKEDSQIKFDESRKYMIDNLFYSIADLLSITAKETDSSKSIFSKHFKQRKRIIKRNIDYDTFFKK